MYCSIEFHILLGIDNKTILKILKEKSEAVSRKRTGNTIVNRKKTKVFSFNPNYVHVLCINIRVLS